MQMNIIIVKDVGWSVNIFRLKMSWNSRNIWRKREFNWFICHFRVR